MRSRARIWGLRLVRLVTMRVRRAYYVERAGWTRVIPRLPSRLRASVGLDDAEAVGSRKIELGGGPYPQPGYQHVDADRDANHLEAVAPAWNLPFPDQWADEIVAVHIFEHVHPRYVPRTLAEFRRVLKPGGRVQLHVPNAQKMMEKYLSADPPEKWRYIALILGMYSFHPMAEGPTDIRTPSDHQQLLDWPLLSSVLEEAGFTEVTDLSATVRDRHSIAWAPIFDQVSLIVSARTPAAEAEAPAPAPA